eukprot:Ihof_evm2s277 gene=Ihof_evmTU2s277
MPRTNNPSSAVQLEYETFGDRTTGEPLVLIMGLTGQMIMWPLELCFRLVDQGFFVIRFDNRDVGLSTKLDSLPPPNILYSALMRGLGYPATSPYSLEDMADDTFGLMDELGIDKAHVCGASMGGMIGQLMAIHRPERILSLTSIMSTTGSNRLPWGSIRLFLKMLGPRPTTVEERVERGVDIFTILSGGPEYTNKERLRDVFTAMIERSYYYDQGRQFSAILSCHDRTEQLQTLKVPTLVIHGRMDPLLPLPHGEATAQAIPNSKLLVFDQMGHNLPECIYPEMVKAIATLQ